MAFQFKGKKYESLYVPAHKVFMDWLKNQHMYDLFGWEKYGDIVRVYNGQLAVRIVKSSPADKSSMLFVEAR